MTSKDPSTQDIESSWDWQRDQVCDILDLGSVTTTGDTDTDVQAGELVKTDDQERLVDL